MSAARRVHGKRSAVAKLRKVRALISRKGDALISREARIEIGLALLCLDKARKFLLNAEHLSSKTL